MAAIQKAEPSQHLARSIIARAARDLENSSFLSACDCVSVANTILHLKLTGRLEQNLGYDESLMLVSSTRREVRIAYLLLMDLYYSANRGAFAESLFRDLFNNSADNLEKILLLNSMMTMRGDSQQSMSASLDSTSTAQIKCLSAELKQAPTAQLRSQAQAFNENIVTMVSRSPTSRPPPEVLNRLLVYLSTADCLTDQIILDLGFASHLTSTTCNTICQLIRSRVRKRDIDFLQLIPQLLRRILQSIENLEEPYLALPDPWFLTNALKLLRLFFPTRYIAQEAENGAANQEGAVISSPVNPPSADFVFKAPTSRFHRSASLLISSFTTKHSLLRRHTAPNDLAARDDPADTSQSIPILLGEVLSKILQFKTNQSFTPAQYRHHRNVLGMVRAEACRLIYSIQPSDYWLDQALEETSTQFKTLNTNTIRNAVSTWTIAAQDPSLLASQTQIVTSLMAKLSQFETQGTVKVRIARLLVQIAISDIIMNGLSTFEDEAIENQSSQADNCYDPRFLNEELPLKTTAAAAGAVISPHGILNVILMALGKRDSKSVKIQLTRCACALITACRTMDEETITSVITELLSLGPDVWSTLLVLLEDDKLALKVLISGETLVREKAWLGRGQAAPEDKLYLGWLKLTLHLVGRLGICHVLQEFVSMLSGWNELGSQDRVDREAVCLALISARKIYLGCDDINKTILKDFVNGFLCHEDILVQSTAAETWLSIRTMSFPTCA